MSESSSTDMSSSDSTSFSSESFQSVSITTHKLNGSNFIQWSQSVKLFIRGRGKFGYLSGSIIKPTTIDEMLEKWEAENSMIMAWLINSMEPSIGRTYLFLPSAQEIWTAVTETYSDLGNTGQLYELKTQLKKMRQGEKTVTQYYTELKTLWQELDLFCDFEWSCTKDQLLFQKMLEKERVFDFLAGLHKDLDEVRGRILGRDPLPSSREVFSEVRREESRRSVMLVEATPTVDTYALVTRTTDSPRPPRRGDRPIYDHCNRPGHIKAKCWKLHGKPADFSSSKCSPRENKGYQATSEEPTSSST